MKISENRAKKNLEKQTGIEFDYTEAIYDAETKQYRFIVKMPSRKIAKRFRNVDGINIDSNIFVVSEPDDFEPYKTLADYLETPFFEIFDYIFYDYGNDWEVGTGQGENIYCWTGKGWLEVADIEKIFLSRFRKQRKNISLENEEWIIKIYKNCCRGINYRKSKKGKWATAYECRLSFDVLKDKLIMPRSKRKVANKLLIKKNSSKKSTEKKKTIMKTVTKKSSFKETIKKKPLAKILTAKDPVKKKNGMI